MTKRDYYEILQVSRNAADGEIKKAYRQMAVKYHPDKNPGDKKAEDLFKEASEAYEVLSHPDKRELYDRYGHQGLQSSGFSGFSGVEDIFDNFGDIFEDFFGFKRSGGGRSRVQPGSDLRYDLEIDFLEACFGGEKEIEVTRPMTCEPCHGSGALGAGGVKTCPKCHGSGQVSHSQGFFTIRSTCAYCRGSGSHIDNPCPDCRGQGLVRKTKKLQVKIPAGVDNGIRLMLQGEGEGGERGAPSGDLYVFLHVKSHSFFKREGDNILCTVTVSMVQATIGCHLNINGLKHQQIIEIPSGIQSGENLVLKGAGVANLRSHKPGDQIVQIIVKTPTSLSAEQKELLKKFAELGGEKLEEESVATESQKKKKKKGFFG